MRDQLTDDLAMPLFTGNRGKVNALAATRIAGRPVAFGADDTGRVCCWDVESGYLTETLEVGAPVTGLAASADGYLLVVTAGETICFGSTQALPGFS